jgi:hypothetical protein
MTPLFAWRASRLIHTFIRELGACRCAAIGGCTAACGSPVSGRIGGTCPANSPAQRVLTVSRYHSGWRLTARWLEIDLIASFEPLDH